MGIPRIKSGSHFYPDGDDALFPTTTSAIAKKKKKGKLEEKQNLALDM